MVVKELQGAVAHDHAIDGHRGVGDEVIQINIRIHNTEIKLGDLGTFNIKDKDLMKMSEERDVMIPRSKSDRTRCR